MSKIIIPENQTKKIQSVSGLGYYVDSENKIIAKAVLGTGEHDLAGNLDFVEVATKEELDAIVVYQPPKTQDEINEGLIFSEMRLLAIESLKTKAKLPVEYVDKIAK